MAKWSFIEKKIAPPSLPSHKSLLVPPGISSFRAPVSESWRTVTSERVIFDYCILHITISDIFQNFHVFFLVIQSFQIAKLLQDDTASDITWKKQGTRREKTLMAKSQ